MSVAAAALAVDRERGSIDRDGDPTGWGEWLAAGEVHGVMGRIR